MTSGNKAQRRETSAPPGAARWFTRRASDLSFAASAALSVGSGLFALGGVGLGQWLSHKSRRAETENADRRESRKEQVSAYTTCLALAVEFDARLDLFTPTPGELGRATAHARVRADISAESRRTGVAMDQSALPPPLIDPGSLTELKDLLARATSSASLVAIIGDEKVAQATMSLIAAQRRWLSSATTQEGLVRLSRWPAL